MADASGLDVLGRLLPSLGLIVGGLFLVRWWLQRTRGATTGGVKVLARTGITKGSVVAVVQVGARRFLVGAAEQSVTLLSELPVDDPFDPLIPDPPDSAGTDAALTRPALSPLRDRPWMGPIHRLRAMTVRSHLERPVREQHSE